jgi:hypothetical protein
MFTPYNNEAMYWIVEKRRLHELREEVAMIRLAQSISMKSRVARTVTKPLTILSSAVLQKLQNLG